MNKCIVIISGGCDSVTTLYWAKERYKEVEALTFNYGSKHNSREQEFAKFHCNKLNIKHKIITLPFEHWGFKSSLLQNDLPIPEGHYEDDSMKQTVVPFRNGIMLSIATGYADSVGAEAVLLGSHKGDRAQYPDCTEEFTQAINQATQYGTSSKVKIISPFNNLMKWDVVAEGLKLGVDFSMTWSCYNGKERPCLKCGTDVERTQSFIANDLIDPLLTNEEWQQAVEFYDSVK